MGSHKHDRLRCYSVETKVADFCVSLLIIIRSSSLCLKHLYGTNNIYLVMPR